MARGWLYGPKPAPEPDRRGNGKADDEEPVVIKEPTHSRGKLDAAGNLTLTVACYCDATADHA